MKITEKDVLYVAALANLELSEQETAQFAADLDSILAYVEQLKSVPTDHVEPTSHVLNLENVFREDRVHPSNVRDEVLNHAPQREGNFFKVPKVIDQE